MVKLTVLYGHPEDPAAFEGYYANTHMALADKIPNFQRYEAARIVATPDGTASPYYRIFEMYFDDMQQLQSSLSTPEGQAAPNDIPNFATGGAKILMSEVDSKLALAIQHRRDRSKPTSSVSLAGCMSVGRTAAGRAEGGSAGRIQTASPPSRISLLITFRLCSTR